LRGKDQHRTGKSGLPGVSAITASKPVFVRARQQTIESKRSGGAQALRSCGTGRLAPLRSIGRHCSVRVFKLLKSRSMRQPRMGANIALGLQVLWLSVPALVTHRRGRSGNMFSEKGQAFSLGTDGGDGGVRCRAREAQPRWGKNHRRSCGASGGIRHLLRRGRPTVKRCSRKTRDVLFSARFEQKDSIRGAGLLSAR
jgi:hypothetical protein